MVKICLITIRGVKITIVIKGMNSRAIKKSQKSVKIENHKSALEIIPSIQTHYKLPLGGAYLCI